MKYIYLTVFVVVAMLSCKKKDEGNNNDLDLTASKEAFLSYVTNDQINPSFSLLLSAANQLKGAASSFQSTPTAQNLEILQEEWLNVEAKWQPLEVFNFGSVKSNFVYSPVNKWPADTSLIKEHLLTTETIDANFVNWKGSSSKGLAALEFLIFTIDFENIKQNRLDYIAATAELLFSDLQKVDEAWKSYAPVFKAHQLTGVNESVNQLINSIIFEIEYISNTKIGVPLGKASGVVNETAVESPLAAISLQHIEKNLEMIKVINGTENAGLYAYLIANNATTLAENLESEFLYLELLLDGLSNNLQAEITNNPEKVDALYAQVKKILVLYKVDVASTLSVTLTFSDNDGD